ncbi:hypothetical protein ZYGR_0A00590 [Zygosaccharomyces rouxii]|uniref:ZYRO0A01254p n=2 Tax=Zygosaccharomyces rouxii TaxID=4956 RepID=C5DP84_ZYGRC|nr:uncharacterized protein ZYRO0A01254g [Zygosaccharomyces rouxii]KAH9198985.1 fork head domain-containing protein [Zygosaccharomyces rouxii]GAV46467.1 hypothetical protein ZYGR_0A00590 [Zygosaccharomyces rouxii]CAR25495.1 ZYRO0A01254p [Zygosaccharomyces rouxii]
MTDRRYSPQQHQGLVNSVIGILQCPEQPTMVSKQFSNQRNVATEVQAYAKISGRDWTYYVKELEVSIGRNTDSLNLPPGTPQQKEGRVSIDLGPAKVVSRRHAVIKFNMQHGGWEFHVLGRNGAKVNFKRVQTGAQSTAVILSSGTILDVGGTQMMFILPDQEPVVSQSSIDHLLPKLASTYGSPNAGAYSPLDQNALLYDILQNGGYQNGNPPHNSGNISNSDEPGNSVTGNGPLQSQPPQLQQVRTFKMYGNPSSNNMQYGAGQPGVLMSPDLSNSNGSGNTPNYHNPQLSITQIGFPNSLDFASDLSRDENRNVKPPHSYATMITQAILSTGEGVISLADIYKYISSNYAYYRFAKTGWQNSIRHNLSLNKAFEKVPRRPNEPGKGMKWRISEDYQRDFLNKWNSGKIGKVRRGSSVARQLQLHLSKFNSLPAQNDYTPEPTIIKQQSMAHRRVNTAGSVDRMQLDTPLSASSDNASQPQHVPSLPQAQAQVQPPLPQPPLQQQQLQQPHQSSQHQPQQAQSINPSQQPPQLLQHQQQPQPHLQQLPQPQPQPQHHNNHNQQQQQQQQQPQAQRQLQQQSGPSLPLPHPSLQPPTVMPPPHQAVYSQNPLPSSTAASAAARSSITPLITTATGTGPTQISPTQGPNLLRSPTKAFHITAMEAYTPERGSANQNRSPSANQQQNDPENYLSKDQNATGKVDKGRSSPGVWNLLQFSSVNNTPAVPQRERNNTANSNPTTNGGETKDVVSSPLKSQTTQSNGKDLMLDTEGTKISLVND